MLLVVVDVVVCDSMLGCCFSVFKVTDVFCDLSMFVLMIVVLRFFLWCFVRGGDPFFCVVGCCCCCSGCFCMCEYCFGGAAVYVYMSVLFCSSVCFCFGAF